MGRGRAPRRARKASDACDRQRFSKTWSPELSNIFVPAGCPFTVPSTSTVEMLAVRAGRSTIGCEGKGSVRSSASRRVGVHQASQPKRQPSALQPVPFARESRHAAKRPKSSQDRRSPRDCRAGTRSVSSRITVAATLLAPTRVRRTQQRALFASVSRT